MALVERELVGGECSYWGCIPSKTLLRPGDVLAAARRVPGAAEAVSGKIDAAAAFAQRDYQVSSYDDSGQVPWLDGKAPHGTTGCPFQAWSVAELLRARRRVAAREDRND